MYLETYNSPGRKDAENSAYEYLVTDLLSMKKVGDEKSTTLTALNMEQSFEGKILPSMFYTFQYVSKTMEELDGSKFYDLVPMILCTSVTEENVSGINFNLIPNDVRASILDILHDAFKSFYDEEVYNGTPVINKNLASILMKKESCDALLDLISRKTGINVSKAMRTYKRGGMQNVRLIEYDQWRHIPFLSYKDAIRGASLAAIQAGLISPNR